MRKAKRQKISFRQSLFWDVDPKKIDPDKHARYIIERILDFGETDEVRWMSEYYPRQSIQKVIRESRVLHDKSKSLWRLVYQ